jgi:tRNA threonylcarbamoyl adenosine modification protein YeaZ
LVPDATVLGFDTSAAQCAAALLSGGRIVAARAEAMGRGQAERLMPLLEEILSEAGMGWADLSAIGVGTGPGNFTGIRISVSAARGLALGLGVPAIGISGFQALAFGQAGPVLAALPAPRGELYLQVIAQGEGRDAPIRCAPDALPPELAGSGLPCIGAQAPDIAALTGGAALPAPLPPAEAIARAAAARMDQPRPRPAPLYVRPADAAPPSDPPPVLLP